MSSRARVELIRLLPTPPAQTLPFAPSRLSATLRRFFGPLLFPLLMDTLASEIAGLKRKATGDGPSSSAPQSKYLKKGDLEKIRIAEAEAKAREEKAEKDRKKKEREDQQRRDPTARKVSTSKDELSPLPFRWPSSADRATSRHLHAKLTNSHPYVSSSSRSSLSPLSRNRRCHHSRRTVPLLPAPARLQPPSTRPRPPASAQPPPSPSPTSNPTVPKRSIFPLSNASAVSVSRASPSDCSASRTRTAGSDSVRSSSWRNEAARAGV